MAPNCCAARQVRSGWTRNHKTGTALSLLFVLAALADDVGDVLVTLFGFFDEGVERLVALDLDVFALRGLALSCGLGAATGLRVSVFERNQLRIRGLGCLGLGLLGRRACRQ